MECAGCEQNVMWDMLQIHPRSIPFVNSRRPCRGAACASFRSHLRPIADTKNWWGLTGGVSSPVRSFFMSATAAVKILMKASRMSASTLPWVSRSAITTRSSACPPEWSIVIYAPVRQGFDIICSPPICRSWTRLRLIGDRSEAKSVCAQHVRSDRDPA
jgi:hypothetical protein